MKKPTLFWKQYRAFIWIILLCLLPALLFSYWGLRNIWIHQELKNLEERASLLSPLFVEELKKTPLTDLDSFCKETGKLSSDRLTIVLSNGQVVADSWHDIKTMDNHQDRPEVQEALEKNNGSSVRFSHTLSQDFVYASVLLKDSSTTWGVLRVSRPLNTLLFSLHQFYFRALIFLSILLIVLLFLSYYFTKKNILPFLSLKKQTKKILAGDTSTTSGLYDETFQEMDEFRTLLEKLSQELEQRLQIIVEHETHQEIFFSNMLEGVLAIDPQYRILKVNDAFKRIFQIQSKTEDKLVQEVLRVPKLQSIMDLVLKEQKALEEEIILENGSHFIHLQVHATPLKDLQQNTLGALLVFHDQTKIKELEKIRKDFVANVSHELRTPLTAIKGFVETLLEQNPVEPTLNFLKIISKHTQHLQSLVEDLLTLSRLEGNPKKELKMEPHNVNEIISLAMNLCEQKAQSKNIHFSFNPRDELWFKVNPSLLEQALLNLLDNALKYSPENGRIEIKTQIKESSLGISITDQGPGISKEHLSRLFERFYRVDQARDDKLGGTGLGLSIVKHIALTHGGWVEVESQVGKGSIFTLYLRQS